MSQQDIITIVDEVLFYIWDPIGIKDQLSIRDEYRAYVQRTCELLLQKDVEQIVKYLIEVERVRMCLTTDGHSARKAATMLVEWYIKTL